MTDHSRRAPVIALMACVQLAAAGACGGDGSTTLAATATHAHPVVVAGADASDAEPETEVESEVETATDVAIDSVTATATDVESETASETVATGLPTELTGDTSLSTTSVLDHYAAAPDKNESGPEVLHGLDVTALGILRLTLIDIPPGVDVDLHLLSGTSAESCVRRGDKSLAWVVRPGHWTVAVDTWVDAGGTPHPGAYRVRVEFLPLDQGRCTTKDVDQEEVWSACAPGIDCRDAAGARTLATPSLGPVVQEAHLVTTDEAFGGNGWPTSFTDQIARHYTVSEAASGYVMARGEPWAPAGEGGSQYGGGATGAKVPASDEAWYINMYWKHRPPKGTRVLVVEPMSGKAVVAAGGWETGPGSNTAIGGACEEIHDVLGTVHRSALVMGFLADDTLPLGPIDCGWGAP